MGAIGEGFAPPKRNELGDTDQSLWERYDDDRPRDPWQFSNYVVLVNVDTSDLFTFTTSSRGGLNAIGELSKVYGKRIRQTPDELPLVELGCGSCRGQQPKLRRDPLPRLQGRGLAPEQTARAPGRRRKRQHLRRERQPAGGRRAAGGDRHALRREG